MCCPKQYAELGVAGACPIPGPPNVLHQTTTLQTRVHVTCWTHAERKGAAIETRQKSFTRDHLKGWGRRVQLSFSVPHEDRLEEVALHNKEPARIVTVLTWFSGL